MIDHDNLEEFRDAQTYDLEDAGYYDDCPLTEQWAQSLGGPLLDLACGTGRVALRMASQGYQVTGVDIVPEMIARARQKAAEHSVSIEWVPIPALRATASNTAIRWLQEPHPCANVVEADWRSLSV
jgi:2-polyprenyl-3-methyl-5-hydroxy-6-metoxy-1,4-benzoquinol methylase